MCKELNWQCHKIWDGRWMNPCNTPADCLVPILWSNTGQKAWIRWVGILHLTFAQGTHSLFKMSFPFYAKKAISLPFWKQVSHQRFLDGHYIPIFYPCHFQDGHALRWPSFRVWIKDSGPDLSRSSCSNIWLKIVSLPCRQILWLCPFDVIILIHHFQIF